MAVMEDMANNNIHHIPPPHIPLVHMDMGMVVMEGMAAADITTHIIHRILNTVIHIMDIVEIIKDIIHMEIMVMEMGTMGTMGTVDMVDTVADMDLAVMEDSVVLDGNKSSTAGNVAINCAELGSEMCKNEFYRDYMLKYCSQLCK